MPMQRTVSIRNNKIFSHRCEINITEHCNLRCRGCTHLSPILPRGFLSADQIESDLTRLSQCYHAKKVRVLGGEPLLHPDLESILRAIRKSEIGDNIEIITNGTLLHKMPEECWAEIDSVVISEYPGQTLKRSECISKAFNSNTAILFHSISHFKEGFSELGTNDSELVQKIFESCEVAHRLQCHTVHNGYFYRCPQAYFLPKLLPHIDNNNDRVDIHSSTDLFESLIRYLESKRALASCRYCLGSAGKRFSHEVVPTSRWQEFQKLPTEELIDWDYLEHRHVKVREILYSTLYKKKTGKRHFENPW